jgi:CubicO group peptidase (beta-lactamase class C family)
MDFRRDYTEDELLKIVYATPLEFGPGAKWRYSNLAYLTLGVMIHRLTGTFYGDVLQERIFRPLGMATTRIISESDIVPNRSAGYVMKDGKLANQAWVSPSLNTTADGALYFTVLDLAKWDGALYSERLLKRSSLDEMWTPVRLTDGSTHPYGFGWGVTQSNGHRLIEHGGGWQGFLTHIARYPDDRLTVVVLTNLSAELTKPAEIAHQVAAFYFPALLPGTP